jgi:GNAT superfamily N-acetyltransferase
MSTTADPTPTVEIERYNAESVERVLADVARLYGIVYQEPPYCEGPDDVEMFVKGMSYRAASPAFRLALAAVDGAPVGFAFGHQLVPDTKWWQGATTRLPNDVSREYPGRTFAIIELAVDPRYRRRGIAKALHDAVLTEASEERVTLLVRPEAQPAHTAYEHWGYIQVGRIRPWPDAPLYDAMVLNLSPNK